MFSFSFYNAFFRKAVNKNNAKQVISILLEILQTQQILKLKINANFEKISICCELLRSTQHNRDCCLFLLNQIWLNMIQYSAFSSNLCGVFLMFYVCPIHVFHSFLCIMYIKEFKIPHVKDTVPVVFKYSSTIVCQLNSIWVHLFNHNC